MAESTILVGTDFSPPAERTLIEVRAIAARVGSEVEMLHVTASGPGRGWAPGPYENDWLERLDVPPESVRVRRGTPWVELARYAEQTGSLLIAVGSHGRGGYQPLGLGSTAFRLTVRATRPVLVIGRRSQARPDAVVFADDGRTEAGSTGLPWPGRLRDRRSTQER